MYKSRLLVITCAFLLLSSSPTFAAIFTIPDWLLKSCVFVMKDENAIGTGFLVAVNEQEKNFTYFVTAKHVIQPALRGSSILHLRLNKIEGGAEIVEFSMLPFQNKLWIEHGNPAVDLAVVPLAIANKMEKYDVKFNLIDSENSDFLATKSLINRFKLSPGDSVFTLGLVPYLFNKDGENLVMSRHGNISMVGTQELNLPGGKQIAHFLDCAAYGGQSGGPAFVVIERNEKGNMLFGWKISLLGVVTEFIPSQLRFERMKVTDEHKEIAIPMENTGVSKVVPVDYLVDILFSKEQKNFRNKFLDSVIK